MSDFWSADGQARYAAHQAEQAEQEQAEAIRAKEAQQAEMVGVVGNAMAGIVRSYTDSNVRATTEKVERDFRTAFPQAGPGDFRTAVDALKQQGILYEVRSGNPGFMGAINTHLHCL